MPEYIKPLEDRVYDAVKDEQAFTVGDIKKQFPTENDRALYRAVATLESSGRIHFRYHSKKRKVYSTKGISKLPLMKTTAGSMVPITYMIDGILGNMVFNSTGFWTRLAGLNSLPIDLCAIVLASQEPEEKKARQDLKEIKEHLIEKRATVLAILEYINTVLSHPTMSGDLEYFQATFREEPVDPKKILEYRRWLTANFEGLRNYEDHN